MDSSTRMSKRRGFRRVSWGALGAGGVLLAVSQLPLRAQQPAPPGVAYVDQGSAWKQADREAFYTQDQGSQVIPLAWIEALAGPDGKPFLADGLARYGYLANPAATNGLPIGFTATGLQGGEMLGMTCSACHTRDIEVGGQPYRIDGGPAIADFQAFLADLDAAVGAVRATPAAFDAFATRVLGSGATPEQRAALRTGVDVWYDRQHTLFTRSFPPGGWGLGRLDAVAMIFNRLTGLDIGPGPNGIIAANIQTADAPVRYPFLWNAPKQDFTQWPGFSENGNDILGLVRNLGEVYGVFAAFAPRPDPHSVFKADFLAGNSADFGGLANAESLVKKIGPPHWPWPVDLQAAARGETIYAMNTAAGGCADCHGVQKGAFRFTLEPTWKTPLQDVGTDSREYSVLGRYADTGLLKGAGIPTRRLGARAPQFDVLAASVVGSIAQKYSPLATRLAAAAPDEAHANTLLAASLPPMHASLLSAYDFDKVRPAHTPAPGLFKYEARVLRGIWAAAPYLHNGSVATLADLLTPSTQRPTSFEVGRGYDTAAIGLAKTQTGLHATRTTTGCDNIASGNSHCGHDFGTTLTAAQKRDLLEYLKTL